MHATAHTNFSAIMHNIFSTKFTILIVALFIISTALTYALYSTDANTVSNSGDAKPATVENPDMLIDKALGLSLNGFYNEAFQILNPLAQQGNIRAKLYLGVAYYHGHGVTRNIDTSRQLFLELQEKSYEPGIVNTYLNLMGSLH